MALRSFVVKIIAKYLIGKVDKWSSNPIATQQKWFHKLISEASNTAFGIDHHFVDIRSHADFCKHVPVTDYEGLKSYVERVKKGEKDVLWKGQPAYFAKTSGTTSGTKYIPISKESIPYHISSARDALFTYVRETGNADFFDQKLIFLSGSPEMIKTNGVYVGRLSGIVNHHIPSWLRSNQLPSYKTNCMDDWESKVDQIVEETIDENMALISGIPPWVQMYFDKIVQKTGKKIKDVFPHFSVFVYGGVNFEPYKAKLFDTIGKKIDSIETYPASEGFIAYQNSQKDNGLLLLLDNGIFYEFIKSTEYFDQKPKRYTIGEVELGINYALILNTNAGLWGYSIGDTVKFVSLDPYKIIVSGRIKHFISAFGEHVIGEEVEKAMKLTCEQFTEVEIVEFTVAPQVVDPNGNLPYHEWFVEFAKSPKDMTLFCSTLDLHLQKINSYYFDLVSGNILQPLILRSMTQGAFIDYMKSEGKLGGQNKLPRLSNDRKIAEYLTKKII